ncbi:hypothetical protein E2K80_10650 [Rhodophyticola sp. CCM32]|uniref:hypothetical protein n=1 Tax=Rhodophyticola sp. CCM32 TaxID=2916397 RepID=UPI00107F25D6|nr:hypothetical protein [Rhodophyticola sp. CCM32]QBY01127.1 hypothetical protein E2K80_10650 [Rhodophyticola sp. CCM32]
MSPVVILSINDASGQRCVDFLKDGAGVFWSDCRRDPEDAHGWRRLDAPHGPYADKPAALDVARGSVGWLAAEEADR